MILEKEKIYRYMRHIILPEISGQGQKKLLESSVLVYGSGVNETSPLVYYLAACGIGHIYCCFEDNGNYEQLFENARDLNKDVTISLINETSWYEGSIRDYTACEGYTFRILLTSIKNKDIAVKQLGCLKRYGCPLPTLVVFQYGWKGILCLIDSAQKLNLFTSILESFMDKIYTFEECSPKTVDGMLSAYLLGTCSVIEGIKMCLNIGKPLEAILYSDLSTTEFKAIDYNNIEKLIPMLSGSSENEKHKSTNYKKLSDSKVLIVGTGGLGSPAAYGLCMAGIGTIGLVDYDRVEISNLNRQILHSESRIGMLKVDSAEIFLKRMRLEQKVITYSTQLNKDNAFEIIKDYDIVISAVDNLQTRYLLNDACFMLKKPMIEAGVLRFDGLAMTIIPGEGSCYRCLFPQMPKPGTTPSCSEVGVLGPVPGVFGFIQASETVKLLSGIGTTLENKLLLYDVLDSEFVVAELCKNPACPLCGENPSIKDLVEYEFKCDN